MVRINGNKLIIEIACNDNETPLEKLSLMQSGLLNLMAIIDYKNAPERQVSDGLCHLKDLLKETIINDIQSARLNDHINSTPALKKQF